jgi:hypothetical protein
MDIKDLIKHSVAKDATSFKSALGDMLQDIVKGKIDKIRPDVAKGMFSEESGDKEAYQKFFAAKLKSFGVSSPDELEGDEKKKFFDEVDAEWEGEKEDD